MGLVRCNSSPGLDPFAITKARVKPSMIEHYESQVPDRAEFLIDGKP